MRASGSRDINYLGCFEDIFASNPVLAPFDRTFADEINVSAQEGFEFGLHLGQGEESPLGGGAKGDEDVDVAVSVEVVAQNGAKQREFVDLPPLAEFGNLVWGEGDVGNGPGGAVGTFYFHWVLV